MSAENTDVDVIVLSSNDECETIQVSPTKTSGPIIDDKCPNSEKSSPVSDLDPHNTSVHETITLSSDSDTTGSNLDSDTRKRNRVSDSSKRKHGIDESKKFRVADKNKEIPIFEVSEKNPTIQKGDQNLSIEELDQILEEKVKKEVIKENLISDPEIEENTTVDVIEENLDDEKTSDEKKEIKIFEEKYGVDDDNLSDISDTSIMSIEVSEEEIPVYDVEEEKEFLTPGEERIELLGFNMETYTVPDTERLGNCRLISEFEKIRYAGRGSFGTVYKALDIKNNVIVALKKMKISLRDEDPLSVNVMRELEIVRDLNHLNIVNSIGIAVGKNFDSTYLILDCCDYDLARVIDDEKSCEMLEEPQTKCIMLQLFEGLKFLHKHAIIHRDLSCSNVLFTLEGILKIGDFGLSRLMLYDEPMTPNIGSRWYRSLELLFGATKYSFSVDLWSAGCIFAEVMLKKPLFKAKTDMDVISLIIDFLGSPNETTWPGCSQLPVLELYELRHQPKNRLKSLFSKKSDLCFDLLNRLLTCDPKQRINAFDAFSHPYFSADPPACSPGDLVPILKVTDEIESHREDYKSEDEAEESEEVNAEEVVKES